MKRYFIASLSAFFVFPFVQAQDKAVFKTYEPGYYQNTILKGIEEFQSQKETPKATKAFKADPANYNIPADKADFTQFWHNDPISQGNTNTCWCFASTSFVESEIFRLTGQKVKLSEMFTVYNEYLERTMEWIRTRGNINIGEGSEGNAVTREMKKYGCLPYDAYSGLLPGQKVYTHEKLFNEFKAYLDFCKKNNIWDEKTMIANVKSLLNYYIGEPPTTVTVNGKTYSPKDYMTQVLKFNPDDYCDVLSYMQQPFWKQCEYEVPDNWWHDKSYYNVPLDVYMEILKKAIKQGYTLSIGGDVSESGFLAREANAAVIPSYDIPSQYINDEARQFRFSNETTTDDHGMHLVGYLEKDGKTWFLVKDSGAGSRTGGKEKNKNFGYYFFHEDYVKLKMMDFAVHKDMMKDYLPKFK